MLTCLLLVSGLGRAAAPEPAEVLCDRTSFVRQTDRKEWATYRQLEPADRNKPTGIYGLSALTVPPAGWRVDAVTIFTSARTPEKWLKLDRARFIVIAKGKGDVPSADDDPRKGKEVPVTVRQFRDGVFAVRAAGLNRTLAPGDYWLGLTPIYDFAKHGQGFHIVVNAVRDARFEDATRSPDRHRHT